MKNIRFSLSEKKLIFTILLFVFVQLLIAFAFTRLYTDSQQINENDIKQIDIIVDDYYRYRVLKEEKLVVVADEKKYLFNSRSSFAEYSVDELYNSISKGSYLSLIYYETYEISGRINLVVEARSGSEVYRTIEEYNRGRQGLPVFVVVMFSVIEIIFVGIILVYVWINGNIFKRIFRKITKNIQNNIIKAKIGDS